MEWKKKKKYRSDIKKYYNVQNIEKLTQDEMVEFNKELSYPYYSSNLRVDIEHEITYYDKLYHMIKNENKF
jgi:hypothetical protein